jgi:hypothetical protein
MERMSRSDSILRDWPDSLKRLSLDELRAQLIHWQNKSQYLGHAHARKWSAKMAREVQREIDARETPPED